MKCISPAHQPPLNNSAPGTLRSTLMGRAIEAPIYREDLLSLLQETDDDLKEKRERFTTFLHLSETELRQETDFVRFLVSTTDELIERSARLNSLIRAIYLSTFVGEER